MLRHLARETPEANPDIDANYVAVPREVMGRVIDGLDKAADEIERLQKSHEHDQDMTAAMALDMSSVLEGKVERLHATEELLAESNKRIAELEAYTTDLRGLNRKLEAERDHVAGRAQELLDDPAHFNHLQAKARQLLRDVADSGDAERANDAYEDLEALHLEALERIKGLEAERDLLKADRDATELQVAELEMERDRLKLELKAFDDMYPAGEAR